MQKALNICVDFIKLQFGFPSSLRCDPGPLQTHTQLKETAHSDTQPPAIEWQVQ